MDNEKLIKSIKELCNKNNISISQLERELNFSPALISRWKDKNPNLDRVIDIADHFHVSLDEVVGHVPNLDDEFIRKLYNQTNEKKIVWDKVTKDNLSYSGIKLYKAMEDEYPPQFYDEEIYGETHYVTKYNKGYIIMYAFYKYDSLLNPKVLKLFIQPTLDSFLVEQKYHQNTLLSLWVKILSSLGDNAPDEVKAEDLKHNFVLSTQENILLNGFSQYLKDIPENEAEIDELLADENAKKILIEANSPDVKQLINIFSDPKISQAMESAQRLIQYFNGIKDIKENKDNNKRAGD